jgi:hypothetical protein
MATGADPRHSRGFEQLPTEDSFRVWSSSCLPLLVLLSLVQSKIEFGFVSQKSNFARTSLLADNHQNQDAVRSRPVDLRGELVMTFQKTRPSDQPKTPISLR